MSRILDYIAKYDENLTIAQLKEAIKQDEISAKEKETAEIDKVKEDFKDVYLKRMYDCDLFGETLQVFHMLEITGCAKSYDCKSFYFATGSRIAFSQQDINFRKLQENTTDTFSEEELRAMIKISIYDYKKYKAKYNEISNELKNLTKWE